MIEDLIRHERLREYFKRRIIEFGEAKAGEIWADDWMASEASARHRRMDRAPNRSTRSSGFEMRGLNAIRGKKAAAHLGEDLFKVAKAVCVEHRYANDAAREIGRREDEGTALLRKALRILEIHYNPDLPDSGRVVRSASGSATAEWQGIPEHFEKQAVLRGEKPPNKVLRAVVSCFLCHREWNYGDKMPECGRAGCKAPGSMMVAMRDE